eukprot:5606896-Pleurochrysis_carterae.AAC.4
MQQRASARPRAIGALRCAAVATTRTATAKPAGRPPGPAIQPSRWDSFVGLHAEVLCSSEGCSVAMGESAA